MKLPQFPMTDTTKAALRLAQESAIAWNHEYVGTEHLLMGLHVADHTLNLTKAVIRLSDTLKKGPVTVFPSSKLPYTPRAIVVLELADGERKRENKSWIGSRHLLEALKLEKEGLASQAIQDVEWKEAAEND